MKIINVRKNIFVRNSYKTKVTKI